MYRNVSWVVLNQAYHFSPTLSIWLVAIRFNFKLYVGLSWNFAELFIILASIKVLFLLLLLKYLGFYTNFKFP